MRRFLVEAYAGGREPAELDALARRAVALAASSRAIRHLGSLVVLDDEICLHLFEAPSRVALARASRRTELAHDRIVEALWLPGAGGLERT